MSQIDDLPPLRDVIKRYDLTARKSLGQNFLLDLNLTARIARSRSHCRIQPCSRLVPALAD